jgi:hypothetical protein
VEQKKMLHRYVESIIVVHYSKCLNSRIDAAYNSEGPFTGGDEELEEIHMPKAVEGGAIESGTPHQTKGKTL